MIGKRVQKAAVTLVLAALIGLSLGASAETPGVKIEVREGDLWSKATVVRKDGSKTLIRYDDNTEEWVTADRLREVWRPPGSASTTRPAADAWMTVGCSVEYKGPASWRLGTITDSQRGWYRVKDQTAPWSVWCEPWLLRAPNSDYDIELSHQDRLRRRQILKEGEPAPADPPGPSPRRIGNASKDVPVAAAVPSATRIDLGTAANPQPGTMTPLNLATTRPTKAFQSVAIRHPDGGFFTSVRSVTLCRDTPGIVVFGFGWFGSEAVEVIRFDNETGQTIGRHPLRKGHDIVGAANSGEVLLTVNRDFRNDEFPQADLYLWELRGNTYTLTAQYDIGVGPPHIQSACMTDATHAIVFDNGGNCFYIDLKQSRAIGQIRTAFLTRIYVDPTGQVMTAIRRDGRTLKAVVIRLSDFSTIAEFPGAAHKGNVAIDPAGEQIAFFSDDGPVRVIRLSDGSVVGNIQVPWQVPGELDFPGKDFLLVDHRYVYDVQTGIPVWVYNRPTTAIPHRHQTMRPYQEPWFISDRYLTGGPGHVTLMTQLANGQSLFCSCGKDSIDVMMATLPDGRARKALNGVDKKTFTLTPGTPVSFAVRGAGSDPDSAVITDAVRNAIKAAGLVLSEKQEDFCVTLSIEPGNAQHREYVRWTQVPLGRLLRSPDEVPLELPSTVVTVEITHKNEPVWSQQLILKGGMLLGPGKMAQGAMNEGAQLNVSGTSIRPEIAQEMMDEADRPSVSGPSIKPDQIAQEATTQVARPNVSGTSINPGQIAQGAMNGAARLDMSQLRFLIIPAYLPTGFTPGTTPALGASDVTPQGLFPSADPPL